MNNTPARDGETLSDDDVRAIRAGAFLHGGISVHEAVLLCDSHAKLRDTSLEEAARIADAHWPEAGHVPTGESVSCAMTISIMIRRLKSAARAAAPTPGEANNV